MEDWRETSGIDHNQRLLSLLHNGLGYPYDVTFVVGREKEEVKGHQLILSLHSPVFESLFKVDKVLGTCNVTIANSSTQDFKQFLEFLYTGRMCDQSRGAVNLVKYAVEYKVRDLEEWCWKRLEEMLVTGDSVVTVYELAIKFQKDNLRDQALEFILSNARTILDSDEFLNFTSHSLFKVMASDSLAATNETQVFQALLRWGREQCTRRGLHHPTGSALRNVLTDLLPMIRFPVMNKSDFTMSVAPLELLNDKELISILLYFNVDKSKRTNIPPGPFNAKERSWYKNQRFGQEYVLHRLEPIPKDPILRREFLVNNGSTYLKLNESDYTQRVHQIMFSVDHPIWICSIGVNSGTEIKQAEGTVSNRASSEITFEIEIVDTVIDYLVGSKIRKVRVGQLNKTFQIYFSKQIQIQADIWYTLNFTILEGAYKPKWYHAQGGTAGNNKSISVEGKTINFGFKEVPDQNPAVIGLTQGFIPTIGFKLHGPKTQ